MFLRALPSQAPTPSPRHAPQGFLYVLDCYGSTRKGFPLQMGDIQVR